MSVCLFTHTILVLLLVPVDKVFATHSSDDTLNESTAACLDNQQIQAR